MFFYTVDKIFFNTVDNNQLLLTWNQTIRKYNYRTR